VLSIEVRDEADAIVSLLGPESYFVVSLKRISAAFEPIREHIAGIAQGGNALNAGASHINSHLSTFQRAATKEIHLERFYEARLSVRSVIAEISSPGDELQTLSTEIDAFAEAFNTFMGEQNAVNAVPLMLKASALDAKIDGFVSALQLIRRKLDFKVDAP
jgi:hypothetical protein